MQKWTDNPLMKTWEKMSGDPVILPGLVPYGVTSHRTPDRELTAAEEGQGREYSYTLQHARYLLYTVC